MDFYLPIAEVYVSLPFIFFLSFVVGILSGLFGVGGGFLMTPFLIFLGIPPAYAVPNEANNILGTSISGSTTHYLKGTLDYKMGFMIVIGGAAGTILGIITFTYFKDIGKIMGIGGAFILVPAMIYIIGMPTKLIPGTSLFVTIFVSAIVTVLHAFNYGSIDLILVTVLILGSIMGVQFGQKISERVDSSEFKAILAILLLLVGIAIAYDTFFVEDAINQAARSAPENLNWLSQFVKDFQKDQPISYGLASIVLALGLGVGAAMVRHFFSRIKKKAEQS